MNRQSQSMVRSPDSAVRSSSDDPLAALSEPSMVLYVSDRAVTESVRAFQLLEETRIPFLVSPATDDQVGVDWGGRAFRGLAEVERLATALNKFRGALATGPWPDGDPEIRRLAAQRLDGYVKSARERMDAILAQRVHA